jgi:hypothetical protein
LQFAEERPAMPAVLEVKADLLLGGLGELAVQMARDQGFVECAGALISHL